MKACHWLLILIIAIMAMARADHYYARRTEPKPRTETLRTLHKRKEERYVF